MSVAIDTDQDVIASFRAAMEAAGISTRDEIVGDDKLRRIHIEGHHRGSRNGWFILHLNGKPAGAFGDYKSGVKSTWTAVGAKPMSAAQRKELRAKAKADAEQRAKAEAERQAAAAARAVEIWNGADGIAETHPYLARKGVQSFGLRRAATWTKEFVDADGVVHTKTVPDALLVPLHLSKTNIVSLQAIFPDSKNALGRDKDFITDGRKLGTYFMIGKPIEIEGKPTILIGEGYATCASAYQATGIGVAVAFDVGNLVHVAKLFRERLPDTRILILADDDYKTVQPVVNPGWTYACRTAKATGGDTAVVRPWFRHAATRGTDFNDVAQADGIEVVGHQIMAALRCVAGNKHAA